MSPKQKANLTALIISTLYIGIGTMELLSIIYSNKTLFPISNSVFDFIMEPSYIMGFGLAFTSGTALGLMGQAMMFGIIYVFFFLLFFLIFKLLDKKKSAKQ